VRVGTWSARYVHEASVFNMTVGGVQKEIAFCCGGQNTGYLNTGIYVVDVTNKANPVQLQYMPYANSSYCHQCWPSPDKTKLYVDDELDDENFGITNVTRVFDINSAGPTLTLTYSGTFTNGSTAIDHNLYTETDRIYSASYRAGLRVYSTSGAGTPSAPVEVGFFDTYPEDDDTQFNGLWNVYPYFPSGTVIGSDLERGLFVWWVGTPPLAITFPGGTPALIPPGGMVLQAQVAESAPGTLVPGSVVLHYDAGAGYQSVTMQPNAAGGFAAAIPPGACGSNLAWYVSAQATNGITWTAPQGAPDQSNLAVYGSSIVSLASHNFETAAGWTIGAAGDTATAGVWQRADPQGTAAQTEDDHSAAGALCFVTGASAGSGVGSFDVDGGRTTLLSPVFDLSAAPAAKVSYWRWYSNDQGGAPNADTFRVDISGNGGTNWVNAETVGPASIVEAALDDFAIVDVACAGYAAICAGDGGGTPCPCANEGAPGTGCRNSTGNGALLAGSGVASVGTDTFVLSGSGMTLNSTTVYVQSSGIDQGGLGTQLGDGLRCIAGSALRLVVVSSVGSSTSYPSVGDPSISVLGGVTPGSTFYYHLWYRDDSAVFCTSATYNYSNGLTATWAP